MVVQPKLIIHGGAGSSLASKGGVDAVRRSLHSIAQEVYELLKQGCSAKEAVIKGCQLLEDEPRFNAGTGSVLQSDGQIRMSAGLMDGSLQKFSGVINVSRVKNPIELAKVLQEDCDRLVSGEGAQELARELQLPVYNPLTDLRVKEWLEDRKDNQRKAMASVLAGGYEEEAGRGTIGVVALDSTGKLMVGTSTGGKGFERICRVSDSAMPAGTYADHLAAVSCTGIGEDIINECLAARIVVRVNDGLSLPQAMEKSIKESLQRGRDLGAISLDATGVIAWGKTCPVLVSAYHDGKKIGDTLDMAPDNYFGATGVDEG